MSEAPNQRSVIIAVCEKSADKPVQFGPIGLALALMLCLVATPLSAAQDPARGLWVGEVVLTSVNEVSVAVNAQNVVVAPDPAVPTPTADAAHLRLLLHVDNAGKVRLLKSVAVINKSTTSTQDLALVTDAALYSSFPGIAKRFSAVAFDFGDLKAYVALTNIAGAVATAAANAATASSATSNGTYSAAANAKTNALRYAATNTVLPGSTQYTSFVASADVTSAASSATLSAVQVAYATAKTPGTVYQDVWNAASSAALKALTPVFTEADALTLNQVDLMGGLLAGGQVTGTFFLGAAHPTNPFRHRMHPDHSIGYDIIRTLELDITPGPNAIQLDGGGYGVDRLSGIYKEEIHGLHKPLGPNQDIGLKVAGAFTLNRLTTVATLNQ